MAESSKGHKAPPALNEKISYTNWKKEIEIWDKYTTLKPEQKGPAIFFQLEGEARDAVRELGDGLTNPENGLKEVLKMLDNMYLKDECILAYESYETFESFKRPTSMSINDYVVKFESLHRNAKSHKMDIHDGVLAYRLLNNANLSEDKKQLVKATLSKMTYDEMKDKLKKVFTSSNPPTQTSSGHGIKLEPEQDVFQSSGVSDTYYYSNSNSQRGGRGRGGRLNYRYMGSRSNSGYNSSQRGTYSNNNFNQRSNSNMNPSDANGKVTRCLICDSKFHWADKCPERSHKL